MENTPTSFAPRPAVLVERRTSVSLLLALLTAIAAGLEILFLVLLLSGDAMMSGTVSPIVGGIVVALLAGGGLLKAPKARRAVTLAITAEGVLFDGKLAVRRDAIEEAFRYPGRAGPAVHVKARRRALRHPRVRDLELESEADADAVLEALAKDDRQATLAFRGVRGGAGVVYGVYLGAVALLAAGVALAEPNEENLIALAMLTGLLTVSGLAMFALQRCVVIVGADGVRVRSARTEFYPYHQLRGARRDGSDLVLELSSGNSARITVGSPKLGTLIGPAGAIPAEALVLRITEARARYLAGASPSDLAAGLARGDRDVRGWVESVKELIEGAASYRPATVPRDRYWAGQEDPTQPASARAGAAVALRGGLGDGERSRLRVAKAACASKELSGAFEAVEEDDDEGLERALRALRA